MGRRDLLRCGRRIARQIYDISYNGIPVESVYFHKYVARVCPGDNFPGFPRLSEHPAQSIKKIFGPKRSECLGQLGSRR